MNQTYCVFILIVSPKRSSRDTMDLRSSPVCVRRVRRDFLVNTLQDAILNRFPSNLVWWYIMARARNLSILVATQLQLWPPVGKNQNNCTLSCQCSTGYSSKPIFFIFDVLLAYGNMTTPIHFGRHIVTIVTTRGLKVKTLFR